MGCKDIEIIKSEFVAKTQLFKVNKDYKLLKKNTIKWNIITKSFNFEQKLKQIVSTFFSELKLDFIIKWQPTIGANTIVKFYSR